MRRIIFWIFIIFWVVGCSCSKESKRYEPTGSVVNTKTLIIGVHPYLNSKKMYCSYRPILDYLEDRIDGISFRLEASSSYSEYDKKLYRGDFHFSLPNPFETINSLEKDYRVIAKMTPDSVFRGIFVARKDAHLKEVIQLQGKSISFPAPTALAATMMPLYYLHQQGIDVSKDIKKEYVGSQYSSILNAYNSNTIAGATWTPPWESWVKENPQKAKEMEVVWQTKPLINNGFVVRSDVDINISKAVARELVSLSSTKEGKKLLEVAGFAGFVYANDRDYSVVNRFIQKYDKAIGLPK